MDHEGRSAFHALQSTDMQKSISRFSKKDMNKSKKSSHKSPNGKRKKDLQKVQDMKQVRLGLVSQFESLAVDQGYQ